MDARARAGAPVLLEGRKEGWLPSRALPYHRQDDDRTVLPFLLA